MPGRKDRGQPELFIAGLLPGLIPDDHGLGRIDQVPDLEWLRAEGAAVYGAGSGRPGIGAEGREEKGNAGFG